MEKYQLGEHDKTTYLLQAAHVQEGEYFSKRVHDDIDGIIEGLRQADNHAEVRIDERPFIPSGGKRNRV